MPAFLEAGPLKARRTDPRSVPLDDTMWIASISSAEGMARVSHRFNCYSDAFHRVASHVIGGCRKGSTNEYPAQVISTHWRHADSESHRGLRAHLCAPEGAVRGLLVDCRPLFATPVGKTNSSA